MTAGKSELSFDYPANTGILPVMTIELNETNFQSEVLDSHLPVLVDFWVGYCDPCMRLSPV